jgi:hypothetical protein
MADENDPTVDDGPPEAPQAVANDAGDAPRYTANVVGDLVLGTGAGSSGEGIPVPHELENLHWKALRYDPETEIVVDIRGNRAWFIDEPGFLHLRQLDPSWQPITADWDDVFQLQDDNVTWAVIPKPDARKATLRAFAAAARWNREQGSTIINGTPVSTDTASQSKLKAAQDALASGMIPPPIPLKTMAGWIDADLPTIEAIYAAVVRHVQACYAKEREIDSAIDAGTMTTEEDIQAAFDQVA